MLPHLKHGNNYTAATWAALEVIIPVCRGEYSYETYQDDESIGIGGIVLVIFIFLLLFGARGLFFFPFGSFTSGRSSGFGGGWGGFGGGSFGGGGAGGSW